MLDIQDISKKDKVFCFIEGLKLWAKTKFYEQKVQDLASAFAVAERLFDCGGDQGSQKKNVTTPNPQNRISKPNSPRNFTNYRNPYLKL
ncbi:reverse transcriptase [Cucumis melo var. makuwa]|uniref:Reverse transcriptase n=1 Tax=Cucumis melo var. makuwa TaxID=1194695 RepID=A0A5A7V3G3_CUCMM|nr:reverse transcriptase [Cucumis melo var. makuwa]